MSFQNPIITELLMNRVIDGVTARLHGIHGLPHWLRVEDNALQLARAEGGDPAVASLFALFHDCRRWNDDADDNHGERGGELARQLHTEGLLPINETQLDLLIQACEGHTDIIHSHIPTIGCCWDADRLDLTRLGIHPDPELLNTESAKEIARELALTDLRPSI